MKNNTKVVFWRLQEVEIPLVEGKTVDDLLAVMKKIRESNDGTTLFDFPDLIDWDNEEVINEDHSGFDWNIGVKNDNVMINDYREGHCLTFDYVSEHANTINLARARYWDRLLAQKK